MRFEKHVFICANQKAEGKPCCGEERGMELVKKFKQVLRDKGLQGKIRAQRAGCLDACEFGPALVIYPEGTYYGHVTTADVERIVEQHLLNNKVVTELELKY
ncbi:MAG: (2Fe-2S) ferredoxin domain-containing protein [Bacteroidia bacterium]|nr:(2Fe-2S) ferredoxin domain-containing protein [Bacteroidia bacterium]MCZ2141624.1 (2Fe-2S) ferredoxin domain-containing protein [Bacteroidia bacterium]